jgi:hypothetical protein
VVTPTFTCRLASDGVRGAVPPRQDRSHECGILRFEVDDEPKVEAVGDVDDVKVEVE